MQAPTKKHITTPWNQAHQAIQSAYLSTPTVFDRTCPRRDSDMNRIAARAHHIGPAQFEMNVNAPTKGIEYELIPLYAFDKSIDDNELEFPRAKNETCCIHKHVIANHRSSAFDFSSNNLCPSKS